jgi:hypothetical protein
MESNSDRLSIISFRAPTWKIPFYELIGGKLNLIEFEKEVYKLSELEFIIEEDVYIDLVSFNYTNNHCYNDVVNLILEKILLEEDEYYCRLFVLIGKSYLNDIQAKTIKSRSLPEAVINIFEGAHINVNWTGVENPACDIEFSTEVRYLNRAEKDCRNVLPLSAVSIGYACNSDIELIMDDDGIVYVYLHIIDELYCTGEFLKALKRLFFGLEYGELLCRSEQHGD